MRASAVEDAALARGVATNSAEKFLDRHAAAGGFGSEIVGVDLVKGSKIYPYRQKARRRYNAVKSHAGSLQNGGQVFAALSCLRGNPVWHWGPFQLR